MCLVGALDVESYCWDAWVLDLVIVLWGLQALHENAKACASR